MLPITFCLDFGNTRLKCGVFEGNAFKEEILLENDRPDTIDALMKVFRPKKSILSSVIRHDEETEILLKEKTVFHKLTHSTQLNFTNPVAKPETIGADRLALAAAAVHFFPERHNLVIALGSCVTYNFINQQRAFIGGAISPGMEMRFRSMHEHTALLPLGKPDWNFPVIAYNTLTHLQSGVQAGMVFEMDGFIGYYQQRYHHLNVVVTGGDAHPFARLLKQPVHTDIHFLFKGLYALSELNNPLPEA